MVEELEARGSTRAPCTSSTKDVLIIVSSVSDNVDVELDAGEVCYRKTGTLKDEDKEKLMEENVLPKYWNDEAKILEARFLKGKGMYNIVDIVNDPEMNVTRVLKKITDLCKTTTSFGGETKGICIL